MKLLTNPVIGCFCLTLLISSNATVATELTELSPEEEEYVLQECEKFATEDEISSENHLAYIETCVAELSEAVQMAISALDTNSQSKDIH